MKNVTEFRRLIEKHFSYLVTDYNFNQQVGITKFGETVFFRSSKLVIRICEDRDSIFVFLQPIGEPEIAQLELASVMHALSISTPPALQGPVAPAQYDYALETFANQLRLHCKSFLQGDFSEWLHILKSLVEESKRDYRAKTHKDLPAHVYQELDSYIRSKEYRGM